MDPTEQTFHLIKTKLRTMNRVFEDGDFKPRAGLICLNKQMAHSISWLRPKDLYKNIQFINDEENRKMAQNHGKLDDIGIPAAIYAITLIPQLFTHTVPIEENKAGYCGLYLFRFWRFGEWCSVFIDDRLPFHTFTQKFVFTSVGIPYDSWRPLLEKAYAKLYGSYWTLELLNLLEIMEDFTGCLGEYYDVSMHPSKSLVPVMSFSLEKGSIILCSTSPANEHMRAAKIKDRNYFLITKLRSLSYKKEILSFIRLKKIWGSITQWTDLENSAGFSLITVSTIKDVLREEADLSGEFWMQLSEFEYFFDQIVICNFPNEVCLGHDYWEHSVYTGKWIKGLSDGGPCKNKECYALNPQFRIEVTGDDNEITPVLIGLMQKPNLQKKNAYLEIGVSVFKVNVSPVQHLHKQFFFMNDPVFKAIYYRRREVSARVMVPPGKYVIVPSTAKPGQDGEFLLRVYSVKPSIMDIPRFVPDPLPDIFETILPKPEPEPPLSKGVIKLMKVFIPLVGQPIVATASIIGIGVADKKPICVYLECQSITTTGFDKMTNKGIQESLILDTDEEHECTMEINYFEYARKHLHETLFTVVCTVFSQGGQVIMTQDKEFMLRLPEFFIKAPMNAQGKFTVESWFVNPMPCPIDQGVFVVKSDQLEESSTAKVEGIGPLSRAVTRFEVSPQTTGTFLLTVRFMSKMFNLTTNELELIVLSPSGPASKTSLMTTSLMKLTSEAHKDQSKGEMSDITDRSEQSQLIPLVAKHSSSIKLNVGLSAYSVSSIMNSNTSYTDLQN